MALRGLDVVTIVGQTTINPSQVLEMLIFSIRIYSKIVNVGTHTRSPRGLNNFTPFNAQETHVKQAILTKGLLYPALEETGGVPPAHASCHKVENPPFSRKSRLLPTSIITNQLLVETLSQIQNGDIFSLGKGSVNLLYIWNTVVSRNGKLVNRAHINYYPVRQITHRHALLVRLHNTHTRIAKGGIARCDDTKVNQLDQTLL
jgi:hypothetical protein